MNTPQDSQRTRDGVILLRRVAHAFAHPDRPVTAPSFDAWLTEAPTWATRWQTGSDLSGLDGCALSDLIVDECRTVHMEEGPGPACAWVDEEPAP